MKRKNFGLIIFLVLILFTLANSQEVNDKKAQKEARKQEREKIEKVLNAFVPKQCSFSDTKISLIKVDRIAKDEKDQNLARETAQGIKGVSRTDGYRVIFAHETDKYLFANFRIDRSRPENYEADKKVVLEYLDKINADDQRRETSELLEKTYNGFASYSSNRSDIVGNTIGITVLFDDKSYIIMTVYFINMPAKIKPELKLFNNFQEWKDVTDRFLNSYTNCVTANSKNL